MIYVWAIIIAFSIIAETLTLSLITTWFAVGGLVALILELCNVSETWQIIAFLVVSIASIFLLRKLVLKFLKKDGERTNADRLIGQITKLLTATEDFKGTVKFNGITYTAISNEILPAGTMVTVDRMEGNKIIVSKINSIKEKDLKEKK